MRELRAYAQLRGLHGPETVPAWQSHLPNTVANEAMNRRKLQPARQVDGLACGQSSNARSAAKQDIAIICRALSELPPDCQAAFRLVRLECLSYDEAARRLHLRPYQVRRQVAHALAYCLRAVESATREEGPV
jgi:RNA polymerase sigma factor (sigma-70 family)